MAIEIWLPTACRKSSLSEKKSKFLVLATFSTPIVQPLRIKGIARADLIPSFSKSAFLCPSVNSETFIPTGFPCAMAIPEYPVPKAISCTSFKKLFERPL